jgi:pantoate--beta-alanine ligase
MITHHTIVSIRDAVKQAKANRKTVCLVPTMGNLHDGHISLVKHALGIADEVVVSLFVNPLQFGPNEDLDSYPRTLNEDSKKLTAVGAHHLFAPSVSEMYPNSDKHRGQQTQVLVPELSGILCGKSRPTHFSGVTTVVSMLFNIVLPDSAVFGKKDFQQLAIIRKMVRDLVIPIEIVGCPIVREEDGLAMSSRNNYLTPDERIIAPQLNQTMRSAAEQLRNGATTYCEVEHEAQALLSEKGFKIDYFSIRNRHNLQEAGEAEKNLIIVAAAWLGTPRLLDNIELNLD